VSNNDFCINENSNKHFRYMNVDYAICNALRYRTQELARQARRRGRCCQAMLDYDISCAWIVNFFKRVAESNHLSIPDIDIIPAVGKFHLGAHVAKCFSRFSLNFISGAGQHDGEIIETLWPAINKISPSIRLMSKASRREMLDDAMRYSNFNKIIGISEFVYIHWPSQLDHPN
jgi:hypothetical protein